MAPLDIGPDFLLKLVGSLALMFMVGPIAPAAITGWLCGYTMTGISRKRGVLYGLGAGVAAGLSTIPLVVVLAILQAPPYPTTLFITPPLGIYVTWLICRSKSRG